jgi:hypothetical protein
MGIADVYDQCEPGFSHGVCTSYYKANFAESLQSLINISFPKIVGERVGGGGGWVVGKFFPDIQNIFGIYQKIFWTCRNLSKNTIIFQDIS